ncbi:MAG TPA: mechanosensitive ion channel domain-containing protein [Gaiellaceae bacterium]|nr:mechanosensitive ion channel domain-containing protein [Gaiellaceae bacterium]
MDSELVQRLVVAGLVLVATFVVARLVDRMIARRLTLRPETLTVYRVVRKSALAVVAVVGIFSALLVVPEVRAVAGAILASSAVVALVFGLAAQATLANFIAGILVAFTQPLRLGDSVSVAGAAGTVQQIGLTYTVIRAADGARFYVPNAKLASDTIRNATIGSAEHRADASVFVPLASDLDRVIELLLDEARSLPQTVSDKEAKASVTQLDADAAVVTVEAWARTPAEAAELSAALRRAVLERLRAEGVLT